MKKRKFDWKFFVSSMFMIAFPIALQNFLSTTASMIDTIMIGSQGETAVAAVGICSQISSLFFSCYFGFASGALLFFSQYWGCHDEKGINQTFGIAFVCMLAVAFLFSAVCVCRPDLVLRIYTDKERIVKVGTPYLRIVGFAYPLQAIAMIISFLMRSTEQVKFPLISSVSALFTNFILNWLLIYGHAGMPKMGTAGAAVGTLVSGAVNVLLLLFFLKREKESITWKLCDMVSWKDGFLKLYMGKCFPIFCNEIMYGIGQMMINIVIGRQSETAIAAMAAFRVLEGFVFAFFGGLADASAVMVGKEIGTGHHRKGYQYTKAFSVLCPSVTFFICSAGLIFSKPLLGLFGLNAEAVLYGRHMIMIYLAAGTIRTCNYIMNSCFRAGGEVIFGAALEITCLFTISVPAVWIAGMVLHLPFLLVFSFIYTDELLRLVFEWWYIRSGRWMKPVTELGRQGLPEFKKELTAVSKGRIRKNRMTVEKNRRM